jgi:hypothetical protein
MIDPEPGSATSGASSPTTGCWRRWFSTESGLRALRGQIPQRLQGVAPQGLVPGDPWTERCREPILIDPVALVPALLLGDDQPGGTERHEVLGDARRHKVGELGGELADGEAASLQEEVEHASTRRFREGLERIRFVSHARAPRPQGAGAADADQRRARRPRALPSNPMSQCRRSHRASA